MIFHTFLVPVWMIALTSLYNTSSEDMLQQERQNPCSPAEFVVLVFTGNDGQTAATVDAGVKKTVLDQFFTDLEKADKKSGDGGSKREKEKVDKKGGSQKKAEGGEQPGVEELRHPGPADRVGPHQRSPRRPEGRGQRAGRRLRPDAGAGRRQER